MLTAQGFIIGYYFKASKIWSRPMHPILSPSNVGNGIKAAKKIHQLPTESNILENLTYLFEH